MNEGSAGRNRQTLDNAYVFHSFEYGPGQLVADGKLGQNALVTLGAGLLQISKQPTALRDQDQQTPARGMVFLVGLEMLGELEDSSAQQSDLYFRRPRVSLVVLIPGDYL
jgi:hypothetical protein